MAKRFTVELKEGTTLHRNGIKHRRGVAIQIDASEAQDYRNSGRFIVSEVDDRPRPQADEKPRRRRARSETRSREAARAQGAPAAQDAPKPPPAPVSPERLAKLAEADVSTKLPRPTLEKMAEQLGATGPEGEAPDDAQNKPTLVKWIQKRQGEVLADLQGDDDPPADDPEESLVPDGDDDADDDLVPDGDDEE